jgi:integrase
MRKTKFRISERKNATSKGNARFRLSGTPPGGKQMQEYFPSRAAAEARRLELEADITRAGIASINLSAAERRELASFKTQLSAFGKGVGDAVAFYLEHLNAKHREASVTVQTAVDQLLDVKEAAGLSKLYIGDLKAKLRRFTAKFGRRACSSIETGDVRKWLKTLRLAPVSLNDYRRVLCVLFNFAHGEGFCRGNPVAKVEAQKEVRDAPGIVRAADLPAVLRFIRVRRPALLAPVVIQLFAGVRTAEVCRLQWQDVRLEDGRIEVNARSAKNAVRRPVHLPANLIEWLVSVRKASGPVAPRRYITALDVVKAELRKQGIDVPRNAFRHSFGTYFFAKNGSTHETADVMGNSPKVVKAHYRAVVSKRDAQTWFSVTPATLDAVAETLPFPATEDAAAPAATDADNNAGDALANAVDAATGGTGEAAGGAVVDAPAANRTAPSRNPGKHTFSRSANAAA